MNFKQIMLSMVAITYSGAQELDFGLSKTHYDNETYQIINEINTGNKDLKDKTNKYFKIASETNTKIQLEGKEDYTTKFSKTSEYVRKYEETKKRDKEEREITQLRDEIKEQIKQLESDLYHSNRNDVHTDENKLRILEKGAKNDIEQVNRNITKHMKELESVIGDMQTKETDEQRKLELFNKEADKLDKDLLDLLVEVEKINGKEDLNKISNAQMDYLKSNDRDFNEIIDDFNREIKMGN